tara:strand:- start:601 stop:840 length:240 start_codon:yes stop_codon:yes gene_type:complete
MIKIFMAIIITSMPGWESVRYQGYIYPDLETCLSSTELYVNDFKEIAKNRGDKNIHFESTCFEINSYPIEKFNSIKLGI